MSLLSALHPQVPANPKAERRAHPGCADRPKVPEEHRSGCHFDHKNQGRCPMTDAGDFPCRSCRFECFRIHSSGSRRLFWGAGRTLQSGELLAPWATSHVPRGCCWGLCLPPAFLSGLGGPALCRAQASCSLRTAACTSRAFSPRYWWQFSVCRQGSVVH